MNNNITKKIVSIMAAVAMMVSMSAPAAAATFTISGNGDSSNNTVQFETESKTSVTQINDANVDNNVDANASTGGNNASRNTSGEVSIDTGDATTDVTVENTVNSNAYTGDCCNSTGDVEVLVQGNGTESDNDVVLEINNETSVKQWNDADIDNDVDASAKTGYNNAGRNTGADVSITTGVADTVVVLSTTANANSARVGGSGDADETNVSLRILNNGDSTDNEIELELNGGVELEQGNDADVDNYVDAYATTGMNDADRNTAGDVIIDTGDAMNDVSVDNMVNFNAADLNCGCVFDVTGKISGNGVDSDNDIKAALNAEEEVGQYNDSYVDNDVDAGAKTGYNEADRNTGEADSDPSIETGDAENTVEVGTTGNSNVSGQDLDMDWDFSDMGFNFNFSFDLEDLLDALMDMMN